jgi:hypothetical protein
VGGAAESVLPAAHPYDAQLDGRQAEPACTPPVSECRVTAAQAGSIVCIGGVEARGRCAPAMFGALASGDHPNRPAVGRSEHPGSAAIVPSGIENQDRMLDRLYTEAMITVACRGLEQFRLDSRRAVQLVRSEDLIEFRPHTPVHRSPPTRRCAPARSIPTRGLTNRSTPSSGASVTQARFDLQGLCRSNPAAPERRPPGDCT